MTRYRVLPAAREELRSAARWYEQQRDGLGHALIDEFEERLALALEHPRAGTIVGSTTQGLPIRRHRLARFARYSVLMFVDEDGTATVLALSHSSRDPVHWKDRIRQRARRGPRFGESSCKERARPKPGPDGGDPKVPKLEPSCRGPRRLGGAPDARGLSSGDSEADPDEPPQEFRRLWDADRRESRSQLSCGASAPDVWPGFGGGLALRSPRLTHHRERPHRRSPLRSVAFGLRLNVC